MARTYSIHPGELVVIRKNRTLKYWGHRLLNYSVNMLWVLLSLLGSGFLTFMIYWNSMPASVFNGSDVYILSDSITTGALFATFGSAVISVFTLSTSRQLNFFYENLGILREDLAIEEPQSAQWKRWPFLPRIGKLSLSGKIQYTALNNASICFQMSDKQMAFPFPTGLADFWELHVLRSFLRMKWYRRTYLKYLESVGAIREYLAWDCVSATYKNILM